MSSLSPITSHSPATWQCLLEHRGQSHPQTFGPREEPKPAAAGVFVCVCECVWLLCMCAAVHIWVKVIVQSIIVQNTSQQTIGNTIIKRILSWCCVEGIATWISAWGHTGLYLCACMHVQSECMCFCVGPGKLRLGRQPGVDGLQYVATVPVSGVNTRGSHYTSGHHRFQGVWGHYPQNTHTVTHSLFSLFYSSFVVFYFVLLSSSYPFSLLQTYIPSLTCLSLSDVFSSTAEVYWEPDRQDPADQTDPVPGHGGKWTAYVDLLVWTLT